MLLVARRLGAVASGSGVETSGVCADEQAVRSDGDRPDPSERQLVGGDRDAELGLGGARQGLVAQKGHLRGARCDADPAALYRHVAHQLGRQGLPARLYGAADGEATAGVLQPDPPTAVPPGTTPDSACCNSEFRSPYRSSAEPSARSIPTERRRPAGASLELRCTPCRWACTRDTVTPCCRTPFARASTVDTTPTATSPPAMDHAAANLIAGLVEPTGTSR